MCATPMVITNKRTDEKVSVPCGKCPQCYARKISGWSFRLMQEDKISSSAHFITLTYDNEKLHRTTNNYRNLCKRDLQLFFKRLRKENKNGIKYYACGEYGSKFGRPHYHVIMFNADINTVQSAWGNGFIHYDAVNAATIGYCLKYMSKPSRIPMHRNDDRQPEFSLMSKSWGPTTLLQK